MFFDVQLASCTILCNVVKVGPAGEPEKALGHGSKWSNRSNQWLDRITVDPKCEVVDGWIGPTVRSGPVKSLHDLHKLGGKMSPPLTPIMSLNSYYVNLVMLF